MLSKIFKKKIKRQKKKVRNAGEKEGEDGGGDDEDDEEDEDDYEDDDDDDDEDTESEDEEGGREICPSDMDPASFTRVLELRELKLDQEEILAEIQKAVDALKKEHDGLLKREKAIDAALRGTEAEIQDFQNQKQRRLNELDVVVPLRLHQVLYLEQGGIPGDLGDALVFSNTGLARLKARIKELGQEKTEVRRQHRDLRRMHVALVRSRREKRDRLAELEARAADVQALKFGREVDLEKLERLGINRAADELRERLAREEAEQQKELREWETKVEDAKREFTLVTRKNTDLLERLVELTRSKQDLDESLEASQRNVNAGYSGPRRKDLAERDRLLQLVHEQAAEVGRLRHEIEQLVRKPGGAAARRAAAASTASGAGTTTAPADKTAALGLPPLTPRRGSGGGREAGLPAGGLEEEDGEEGGEVAASSAAVA
ncbi:Cilia- and flagella-associated protein 44 [Cladochytrium tenue]|nr:Cilia- and flagella-associated protein 44 [Cladochytrium tenue]